MTVHFAPEEVIVIRVKFMADELYRSFWNSWYKDILLMLLFSISLVLTVVMCSYYVDLGERDPDSASYEDSVWYDVSIIDDQQQNWDIFDSAFSTVKGCQSVMSYYDRLSCSKEHPLISIHGTATYMKEEDVKKIFDGSDFTNFLREDRKDAFSAYVGSESRTYCLYEFSSYGLNLRAYSNLGLNTIEGEGFTEENMTIRKATDEIPILLGYNYKGIVPVGKKLEIYGVDRVYQCRVAGILEKGVKIPEDGFSNGEMIPMDSYLLFPYGIRIVDAPEKVEDVEKFAQSDFEAMWNALIKVEDEEKLNELADELRKIGEEFQLPMLQIRGVSAGLKLLQETSASSIRIMFILTIVLLCFTFYGLFVTFYDKVQSNSRVYGIYLMNGCSLSMILLPCLLEIALILLPAIFVSRYVFTLDNVGVQFEIILRTAYCIVGVAFIIGAAFVTYLMRGVDTERLIRQKD